MTHLTSQQWRRKVEKEIGQEISDFIWLIIETEDHIETANYYLKEGEKEQALKHLTEKVKYYLEKWEIEEARPLKIKMPELQKTQEAPLKKITPDKRFQALSEIIAALVNEEEKIQKFRNEVLGNKLLLPEEVPKWIKEQANGEQHTLTISLDVTAGEGWEERFLEEAKRFVEAVKSGGVWPHKSNVTLLTYISPPSQWVYNIVINKSGTLSRLKRLAKEYEAFWPEAWAVHFILTGITPPISPAKVNFKISSRGIARINLSLSPHLSGDSVRELYLTAIRELPFANSTAKRKKLQEKTIALAVFAVKTPGSWSWKMKKWNIKYPQWRYKNKNRSTFARDCRAAYEKITGWKWEE